MEPFVCTLLATCFMYVHAKVQTPATAREVSGLIFLVLGVSV